MTFALAVAIGLHQLASIVWVGGMFFAHMALRPTLDELIEGPQRPRLMHGVLRRFFPWVWAAVILLWGSGLTILLAGSGGGAPLHVHLMMGLAAVMTVIFVYIYTVLFRGLGAAIAQQNWPQAARRVALIRRLILVNLILGLITALTGAAGGLVLPQ